MLIGCQEITPPRVTSLAQSQLDEAAALEFALTRVALGDLHLKAGYFDIAYANYWAAHRRYGRDFDPATFGTLDPLTPIPQDLGTLISEVGINPQAFLGPQLGHTIISRIALSLELQDKYRTLALNLEYFGSSGVAQSLGEAYLMLVAAGFCYQRGDLHEYALEPLKQAVVIDPTNPEAYAMLADSSQQIGELESSLSYWRIVRVIANQLPPGNAQMAADKIHYIQSAEAQIQSLEAQIEAGS